MQSEFIKWFEAQHGKRPQFGKRSDGEIEAIIAEGQIAKAVRAEQREYDARFTSALYAWQEFERRG